MKKLLKWSGIGVAAVALLIAIPAALLYLPPVQRWAVDRASAYASEQTGMQVSVERVSLKFPLRLSLGGVQALQEPDTVARVGSVEADVRFLPLLKGQVEVDKLTLNDAQINTLALIKNTHVEGTFAQLSVAPTHVDTKKHRLHIENAQLRDADLRIQLADTAQTDTTETHIDWQIDADRLAISGSKINLTLADGKTNVAADLGNLTAQDAHIDLGGDVYSLGQVALKDGSATYGDLGKKPTAALTGIQLEADSIRYSPPHLTANLRNLSLKEQSGYELTHLSSRVELNGSQLSLPNAKIETPSSSIQTSLSVDLDHLDDVSSTPLNGQIHAEIGKADLLPLLGDLPTSFRQAWPNRPLQVDGTLKGSTQHLEFTDLNVTLPQSFALKASGTIDNPTDSRTRRADVDFRLNAQNASFLSNLLPADTRKTIQIPRGIVASGNLKMDGECYKARINASQGGGTLSGNVAYCAAVPTYSAHLTSRQFPLQNFIRNRDLHRFTGKIDADGRGLDLLSPRTQLKATAQIDQFQYGDFPLDHIHLSANMKNGWIEADVDSRNPLVQGTAQVRAEANSKWLNATVLCDLSRVDCQQLGWMDHPMTAALCGHFLIGSNLKDNHRLTGSFTDVVVTENGHRYRTDDLTLNALSNAQQTQADVACADFHLHLQADCFYEPLLSTANRLSSELQRQLKERRLDHQLLRSELPEATIRLQSGQNNPVAAMLRHFGYTARNIQANLKTSPIEGINGNIDVDSLVAQGIQLDEVRLAFRSTEQQINYEAQVHNYKSNPQYAFNGLVKGTLYDNRTTIETQLYDADERLGVQLGLNATMEEGGLRITPYGDTPILGYKQFRVGANDYAFLGNDQRIQADITLKAADGTGVQIYSTDDNPDALQDLTFSLNRFDLKELLSVLPYTPDISGQLNGDFHLILTDENLSVASAVDLRNIFYEGSPMGNLTTEFVYMPKSDGSHFVDGVLYSEGKQVATLTGTYQSEGAGHLDGTMQLTGLPLSLANGFIEDQLLGFEGRANGRMSVVGSLQQPKVDGTLSLDSAYIVSVPYGVRMRFADTPIEVNNSHVVMNNFCLYGYNDSPLQLTGSVDFRNLSRMNMDMRLMARNFLLIDAKETARSEAYGKAYVNLFASLKGQMDQLAMRGKLDVLGSTDMTYILRDSPLSTDNQLDELVKFVNLNDTTTQHVVQRPELTGFTMDMSIGIDEGAHVECALNADHTNYVDIIGGGDLRMQYNSIDNLRLTGRYTLSSGEMKYSLPIIPLKTFTIKDGSYIEFQGNPMNPRLNITATEKTKATVGGEGNSSRSVEFECGVVITKTLNDMGLEFVIDAPDDMTVSNQLATMSAEERGKLAVTMLTTGMYLADGNTSAFTMNAALSTFLQGQINSIAGSALRTVDLSFGVDNSTSASGGLQTDYSFKFAKRFWNNRLNIQVGGKVSTGADVQNQNQSFFDNVIFEYRLNDAASKYVKLFYERDSYDWLEGNVGEYGAGFVWKRKVEHFRDLFRFKEKTTLPPPVNRPDSIPQDSIKQQNP